MVGLLLGCGKVEEIEVGGATLAEADGTVEAPAGADVVVLPDKVGALVDGPVRLAVDRKATYGQVAPLLEQLFERDGKAVVLVTNTGLKRKLLAIEVFPPGEDPDSATQVAAFANGKMCVNLPGVEAAKCSQGRTGNVDRASTRSIVREAYEAEDLTYAVVSVEAGLPWADVVRAYDGARTCCGKDVTMRVELKAMDPDTVYVPAE